MSPGNSPQGRDLGVLDPGLVIFCVFLLFKALGGLSPPAWGDLVPIQGDLEDLWHINVLMQQILDIGATNTFCASNGGI